MTYNFKEMVSSARGASPGMGRIIYVEAFRGRRPDERRRHSTVDRLAQRIERLGYRVHLEPVATTAA